MDMPTNRLPAQVWVELTSACPLNCVFCSRRHRFGPGRHLDFSLYRRFLDQLENPEIIRLNYSGESLVYPFLRQAIELAAATGAATELVTALIPIEESNLRDLAESPLNRLSVSIHTLDPQQYALLYGGGNLHRVLQQLDYLINQKKNRGSRWPIIDFCVVVMYENLPQLNRLLQYAEEKGVEQVNIHPVIQRHPSPKVFTKEFSVQDYSPCFVDDVTHSIEDLRNRHPNLRIGVLHPRFRSISPETDPDDSPRISDLKNKAPINCEQNPWETLHLLSNGAIVVCEVQDETPMGNLTEAGLAEIWHGELYRRFRCDYSTGADPVCHHCPWKIVGEGQAASTSLDCRHRRSRQFLRGWHGDGDGDIVWSKPEAWISMPRGEEPATVKIQGILPPGEGGNVNRLYIFCNGSRLGVVENRQGRQAPFEVEWSCPTGKENDALFYFHTEIEFRPWKREGSPDLRCLGFALQRLEIRTAGKKSSAWRSLFRRTV